MEGAAQQEQAELRPEVTEGRILSAHIRRRSAVSKIPSRNRFDEFELVFVCEPAEANK